MPATADRSTDAAVRCPTVSLQLAGGSRLGHDVARLGGGRARSSVAMTSGGIESTTQPKGHTQTPVPHEPRAQSFELRLTFDARRAPMAPLTRTSRTPVSPRQGVELSA